MDRGAWWAAVHGVTRSQTWLSDFTFTFHFHALEKGMAAHSSVLAWRISGTGEPGGLPSMGSHRVRHDWSDLAAAGLIHVDNCIQQQCWYITSTLRLFKKTTLWLSSWTLFLPGSLTLGEASCHVVRILRHPMERATLWGTESPANSWWGSGACWWGEWGKKWILQPLSSFRMTKAPVNSLSATSWGTQSQNYPANSPLASWPSETMWDNVCCFKLQSFGIIVI